MKRMFGMMTGIALAASAQAALHTETVEYKQGDTALKGYLAYDPALKGKRPGVLVVHEWWGLNGYPKMRANELAKLGYVAFAADIYGAGVVAKTPQEAGALAGKFKGDRQLLRDRVNAGLEELKRQPQCDPKRVAAIGYCFGGTTVLELARSGADIAGIVSFHGGLDTPTRDAKNIKCKVLICHGGDDLFEPASDIAALQDEFRKAGIDWQMNIYGGAMHGFTNPANKDSKIQGVAYNERADKRSWAAMKLFFAEIFR
ncbi:MAG TPA: dienelactone hydrolase family protein [Verrucomicrobiae bacterium]|nr:dienelactone hydrolase family protein [Verrucomicrobiae bacterium]